MALEKIDALSLFPTLDQDSQKILFFILSQNKSKGEFFIKNLLEKCMFSGLLGKYHKEEIDAFIEKKIIVLSNLKGGKERVFDLIEFDYPQIKYSFKSSFYERSL